MEADVELERLDGGFRVCVCFLKQFSCCRLH